MEGTHCFNPATGCTDGSLALPVLEYDHASGGCSVTGGYVYRGTRSRRLLGMYIYGDYCSGKIWGATRAANGTVTSRLLLDAPFSISTFGEGADGEIYVADYDAGKLYHIVDSTPLNSKRRAVR